MTSIASLNRPPSRSSGHWLHVRNGKAPASPRRFFFLRIDLFLLSGSPFPLLLRFMLIGMAALLIRLSAPSLERFILVFIQEH